RVRGASAGAPRAARTGALLSPQPAGQRGGPGPVRRDLPAQRAHLLQRRHPAAGHPAGGAPAASRRLAGGRPFGIPAGRDRRPAAGATVDLPAARALPACRRRRSGLMIKVMIVDDSAVVRSALKELLSGHPDIQVIATAPDPLFAQQKMRGERPDVLILDIEMPRMDGLTFLRQLMGEAPIATIVFSSLAEQGSSIALDALDAGAVGIMTKPTGGMSEFIASHQGDFMHMIRDAAQVRLAARRPAAKAGRPQAAGAPARALQRTTDTVVAIGTSTGGTQALEQVLTRLPVTCAGLVIVQHMPANFTRMFAQRLNALCAIEVREARDNDRVLSGQA